MKTRFTRTLPLALALVLLCAGAGWPLCFESQADGKLRSGRLATFMPKILESYETGVPDGAVYAVQEAEGYYFKICDEPNQVNYFMKKWAEAAVPGGSWSQVYTTYNKAELAGYIQDGVYLIKHEGPNWALWKYAGGKQQPAPESRLYVQTTPADAVIRVLNIKPKFAQGMVVGPGRYHIEVSAAKFQTEKQWIEVNPGEDATLTVKLKPAGAK